MFMKPTNKIIFKNQKHKVRIKYTIYSDSTITCQTHSISSKGVIIPLEIGKYFTLPKTRENQLKIYVDFKFDTFVGLPKFENVLSEVYSQKFSYRDRRKRKKQRTVVFLRPTDAIIFKQLRELQKQHEKISYIIRGQLKPTDYFLKTKSIRDSVPRDFDTSESELIVAGGRQNAQFEIHQKADKQLLIIMKTRIDKWGRITLSSELRNHFSNFFDFEFFVCKKDDSPLIVVPAILREIETRKVLELKYPRYAANKVATTIIITHPALTLQPSTIANFRKKTEFRELGYPIKSFTSNFIAGRHQDSEIEEKMRTLVNQVFASSQYVQFSEVQIVVDCPTENELGNKHVFDELILDTKDNSLIIVEHKTSFTSSKHTEIDSAIAEMEHFRRKLGERILLILLINADLLNREEVITQDFGDKSNILLIGKEELEKMYQTPSNLLRRISDFKEKSQQIKKEQTPKENSFLNESLEKILDTNGGVFTQCKSLLLERLPKNIQLISLLGINHAGSSFEQEIRQLMEAKGYDVITNVLFGYFGRKMEIDILGVKNDRITIVSCRDASSVKCLMSFRLDLKQKSCKLEYRRTLLNADFACLYVKVTPEVFQKVKEYEGKWVDNVEIIFITT